jgi:ketosteroid isomerase-like protein
LQSARTRLCSGDCGRRSDYKSHRSASRNIDRYLFHITVERLESIGADRVLAFTHITLTGRDSGLPTDRPAGSIYDLADGKIRRIRTFVDRQEALEAVGLRE